MDSFAVSETVAIGNGIATIVVGHWCKQVDNEKLEATLGFKKRS